MAEMLKEKCFRCCARKEGFEEETSGGNQLLIALEPCSSCSRGSGGMLDDQESNSAAA
jgi:hypothetical protein